VRPVVTAASSDPSRPASAPYRPAPGGAKGQPLTWLKQGIFLGAVTPLVSLVARALAGSLDANPIAQAENELGLAALILLVASLACTPLRRIFGWAWPARVRRELGLFAFFFASLHVLLYLLIDQEVDVLSIAADVVKRPFITVGFLAAVLMLPLALTSTSASVRRLGFRRWTRLHQLAYAAAALAAIHFIWRVKIDVAQPVSYAAVLAVLLGVRLAFWASARRRPAA
jgi:methionine sulfoxide reductase heme-binding subunit